MDFQNKLSFAAEYGIVYIPSTLGVEESEVFSHEEFFSLLVAAEKNNNGMCDLVVSSNGGLISVGTAIYDYIKGSGRWRTWLTGYAYSASSIIFLAGKERYVNPLGRMGIHQAQSSGMGTEKDFQAHHENIVWCNHIIAEIYAEHANDKSLYTVEYFKSMMFNHYDSMNQLEAQALVNIGFAHAIKSFGTTRKPKKRNAYRLSH